MYNERMKLGNRGAEGTDLVEVLFLSSLLAPEKRTLEVGRIPRCFVKAGRVGKKVRTHEGRTLCSRSACSEGMTGWGGYACPF